MKNQITFSKLTGLKKSLAALIVFSALSFSLAAQPASCNAHFYRYGSWLNVNFYSSTNHSGTTYSWNFGDGDTSALRNPSHTYALPGAYYVCLTVTRTGAGGSVLCTSTQCDSIHVSLPPPPVCNAHFSHHTICNSGRIDFDAPHNPTGSTYSWNFGDGNTANVRDTDYTYAAAGTYYACLTVTKTDTAGNILCTDTWCDSVHVTTPGTQGAVCDAHFSHRNKWNSSAIDFDAFHNQSGATYLWNFGDGNTATVRDTDYTYAAPGTYYACLTVTKTDTAGTILCTSTWCDSVHVAPPPPLCNAHFRSIHHANNLNVFFDSAHNPWNVTYAWDFGDGSTSTSRDPHHSYAQAGVYNACLTVTNTDTAGVVICTETWCDSVHIDSVHVCNHPHSCWRYISAQENSGVQMTASVYPNPFTENATLHIENSAGNVTLRIFENTGRLVSEINNLQNGDIQLNKNNIGAGLYFYQLSDSNGSVLKGKLMIR